VLYLRCPNKGGKRGRPVYFKYFRETKKYLTYDSVPIADIYVIMYIAYVFKVVVGRTAVNVPANERNSIFA